MGLAVPRIPAPVFLTGWCGILFLYGISAGPVYRTESLRAIIGRECLHGEWLFPVLYGEPFLTKPPGHYVAIGLCSLPFGEVSAASARIPSILAATATVFLMYGLFARTLDARSALLAGLLLPTSILWLDKVPSAEIDMTLVGWVTASLVFFHRAIAQRGSTQLGFMVLSLLCVAGGTLTKWTAPAFFYLTVVPLLLWQRDWRTLLGWRHCLAVAIAIGVCSLWAMAVAERVGWDVLTDTIRKEAAYRFAPKPGAKGYPWSEVATYPLLVLAAHLPLSLFALRTLRPSFWQHWDERGKLLLRLLHCWTWPNLLFWSLVPNHNVRYALPMSPGLMALSAMGFLQWWMNPPPIGRPDRRSWILWAFLAGWIAAKIAFVEIAVPLRTAHHNAQPSGESLREQVPPGLPLYLFHLKDEGVMFYYARPAIRLNQLGDLPNGAFAALIRQEWEEWSPLGCLERIAELCDQQGEPVILVRKLR